MRGVVAVSGGVDSVVLLDMLVRSGEHDLVVAHFDHGIRPDSAADARFVAGLADRYGLPFESRREELGKAASEALARERRYLFLKEVAMRHGATLMTAHHLDDLVETVAINLHRGTGWRGVAVLSTPKRERPLLAQTKTDLYDYALAHGLEWVEDETNMQDDYLRNRLRRLLRLDIAAKRRLADLRQAQVEVRVRINDEIDEILTDHVRCSRYFFTMLDDATARELLRATVHRDGCPLTRPQLDRFLLAIKTARAGTVYQAGNGVTVRFGMRDFIVNHS